MTSAAKIHSFHPPQRILMGPGPSDIPPRVLAVSPDRRWVLVAHMDHWARDIVVADNYR